MTDATHLFRDPISGRECTLHVGYDVDRLRPGLIGMGVRHGTCPQLADVSPTLDTFYCQSCAWNGRLSGMWAIEKLWAAQDAEAEDGHHA